MPFCKRILARNEKKINNPSDKFRKPKKLQGIFNDHMQELYYWRSTKLAKIKDCGSYLSFYTNKEQDMHALRDGNFCNDRLCPVCSYRIARRTAYKLLELLAIMQASEPSELLFLTLTAPNVKAAELSSEITNFQNSFQRLVQTKAVRIVNKGFIRKLEITYNAKEDTYHPHYHVLIAVNKSYFKSKHYIKRDKWLELWQRSKRDESITQVDIRRANMGDVKSIYELATYSSKLKDVVESGQEVFKVFYEAFRNRRIITYNGIFKDLKAKLDAGEVDLSKIPTLEESKVELDRVLKYSWEKDKYIQSELEELEVAERKEFYNFVLELD